VSVEGKGTEGPCQVRTREASASELLLRCRNEKDDVRTGGLPNSRISSRVTCFTAWAASGIKVARIWSRLWCGTWEPVVPMLREKLKWEDPIRVRVLMRGTGAEQPVVGEKVL
jgi:hypothetical protein